MNYGTWPQNSTCMLNFIKILLSGMVLEFETYRGTYRSVETNYQTDGQAQLTVNWLFSCRFCKQSTRAKLLSVVSTCNIQLQKVIN